MDSRNVARSGLAASLLIASGCYVTVDGSLSSTPASTSGGSGASSTHVVEGSANPPPPQVVSSGNPPPPQVVSSGNPPPPQVVPSGNPPPPQVVPSGNPPPPQVVGTPTVFGSTGSFSGAAQGQVYFLPAGTGRLPDFARLTPVTTLYTDRWDVAPRRFDSGFPGIPNRYEWFAVRYTGSFSIATGGTHGFELLSDDGAKLLIDGQVVIDNDGVHPPQSRSASIQLAPGMHTIEVQYFQGPAYEIALQLFVTPPGGTRRIFVTRP